MITLPANYAAENAKKGNSPSIIVALEDSELKNTKTTQADWTANSSESNIDYTKKPGQVLLQEQNLWVIDLQTDKIYEIKTDGTLVSSFSTSAYDAAALSSHGITIASNGTLWVTDGATNKIYNIQTNGTLISSFATSVFDASATSPEGIGYAPDGTLWVCDSTTDKIYNIQTNGTLISSFATSVFDASAITPQGISYANDGTLWVCDAATGKIYNIQTNGTLISSFATSVFSLYIRALSWSSDNTLWAINSVDNIVYNISTNGGIISSFNESVFDVAATGSWDMDTSIYKYQSSGHITTDFDIGSTPIVTGEWQIGDERAVGVSYWVCDTNTDKIYNIQDDGTLISSFATSVFDASAIATTGIAYAANGTFWVCDRATLKIYNIEQDGTFISSFLTSVFDVAATNPRGLSYAPDGTLWVIDTNSDKIYNIEQDGTLISSFATSTYDAAAVTPLDINIASDGTLWVTDDTTNKIYNITTTGTWISEFSTTTYDGSASRPSGISSASDGTLWVTDDITNKIYNITTTGTWISEFATSTYDGSATNPSSIGIGITGTIIYQAWGSATGAFAGEETDLGIIIDGTAITQLFRYYRVKARFSSSADRVTSPVLLGITASFITFVKITDTEGYGYTANIDKVSSLTTKIDIFEPSTIGQISFTTAFSKELSTYFSTPRKNRLVKVLQGFKGMGEVDFINYYYGIIGNAPISTDEEVTIEVDDYTATWSKPIPAKWATIADDVVWAQVHPIDVLIDIFQNYLDVRDSFIDYPSFIAVKEAIPTWRVSRTITATSEKTDDLINELRQLMSCFLIPQPDGRVLITRYDATAAAVATLTDDDFITAPGLSYDPQYAETVNHWVTYYGWNGASDNLDDYLGLDDYSNTTSITAWKEEVYKTIKDKWTPIGNTAQVEARRTIIDGIYGNAPVLLEGKISRRLINIEAGDVVAITMNRFPKSGGFGCTNKKFLMVKKNYNYGDGNIGASFLEV
jgi:sugar lactone lactonase YvrE